MVEGQQQPAKTILVVEDDPAIGILLTQIILQETPYQIVLLDNTAEALRRFREVQPGSGDPKLSSSRHDWHRPV